MGLDSVELLEAFERYFNLPVPDRVAEQLARVGEVAEYFAQQLGCNLSPARTEVHTLLLSQVTQCLSDENKDLSGATVLRTLWHIPRAARHQLQACLQLNVPELSESVVGQLLKWWQQLVPSNTVPARPPDWAACTINDLVDWLLAENYRRLLVAPASLYEVQRVVIGITADKCGINVSEIQLSDSFTMDLGID